MTVETRKNFDPIRDDYLFFQEHSTEAEEDLRVYLPRARAVAKTDGPLRLLDFGSGSGRFTRQFLTGVGIPPERLRLTLVEPATAHLRQAVAELKDLSRYPIEGGPALSPEHVACFDLVLSNHVLYYVADLEAELIGILRALKPGGLFLLAMAGRSNLLIEFWMSCFALIGEPLPWFFAEDLEACLTRLMVPYRTEPVRYVIRFPDTEENRLKIMRFLLGEHFGKIPRPFMLDLFTPHVVGDEVCIRTGHDHFVVRHPGREPG
ncbi:MAG: class I SAM-dependent methyltransferase [Methylococcus sp.]